MPSKPADGVRFSGLGLTFSQGASVSIYGTLERGVPGWAGDERLATNVSSQTKFGPVYFGLESFRTRS